jgi:hypothetical protein
MLTTSSTNASWWFSDPLARKVDDVSHQPGDADKWNQ